MWRTTPIPSTTRMTTDAFEQVAREPQTSIYLQCSPQNPAGSIPTRDELETIGEICLKHDVLIVADEIHSDLILEGRHIPIATLSDEIAQQSITMIAPSKTYNLAGMACSVLIAQNPKLRERLAAALQSISAHVNIMGYAAAYGAYCGGDDWLRELLVYLRANRDYAMNYIRRHMPMIKMTIPQATYLLWLDMRELPIDGDLMNWLQEAAGVAPSPGGFFGTAGEGFARLNFGCPRATLELGPGAAADRDRRLMRRPFLIDTDAGSDDAVAVVMALRQPDIDVRAITAVAGNVPLHQALPNALYFVELCGSDAPVYAGAAKPLLREYISADWFHGADGLGDLGDRYKPRHSQIAPGRAVDAIIDHTRATPDLTIVTLGPLTNLALALCQAPDIAERVSRCVIMGGAACTNGNVTPAAEYNIWCDPEAARIVFRSGMNIEMVGWEFSQGEFVLSLDDIAALREIGTPYADFTVDCNVKGMRGYETQTGEIGISLPDGVAMAVAIDPSICRHASRHFVDVECDSELTRGMTVVDKLDVSADERNRDVWRTAMQSPRKPSICWDVDAAGWKQLLFDLLQ